MKRTIGLALLVAVLFAAFIWAGELLGAQAFYLAALGLMLFAVLGPMGEWLKMTLSMLVGLVIGLVSILTLAMAFPLPPDNMPYVALVGGIAVFLIILLSATGLRIDGMLIGWASYLAVSWATYVQDASQLAVVAVPSALGVAITLVAGLFMAILVLKIAMAVAK